MKIAVTGGMGFIGHELVGRLVNDGHEVTVVDYYQELIPRYEKTRMPIMGELYKSLSKVANLVEPWEFAQDFTDYGPQVVVHAGAVVDTKDLGSEELFQRNLAYTEFLTKACNRAGANLIFISSAAVYGNDESPNNPYGLTKALGEKIIRKSRTKTASLRLFNVFGKFEHHKGEMASVPWKLAKAFKSGSKFDLHSLGAKRDFVPSSAVVNAVVRVADDMMAPGEKWHKTYDVGTGKPTTFEDLRNMIGKVVGYDGENPVRTTEIPNDLVGRFQHYTCAGEHGVENIGGMIDTAEGVRLAYG